MPLILGNTERWPERQSGLPYGGVAGEWALGRQRVSVLRIEGCLPIGRQIARCCQTGATVLRLKLSIRVGSSIERVESQE